MNYLQIARETLAVEEQALARLGRRLDTHFNEIVELILQCQGRLVIGGIGKSGLVGKKMVATFASTGTPSFFLHPTEAFHGDLGMLKPIDIVMLISYSGETDDVNKLIPSLKNFGNKIIALTGNPNSTLAKHSDYVLDISVEREVCPNNLAPTTSVLVTMALGDALAVALIKARDFKPADFARFHPGGSLGRRLLCRVKNEMQTRLPVTRLETSFTDCLSIMNEGRMGVALVMEQNQLKGIITDGDIRRALTANSAETLRKTAQDLMTPIPKTIHQDAYLAEAEAFMKDKKIHSCGSLGRRLLCRVKNEMQTRLPVTRLETSFTDCLSIMNEGRMGVALVMEQNQLKGIITDGDIRRALTANSAETLRKTAQDLMTPNPKTIHQDAYLAEAEAFMKEKKIHSLVVINDQQNVVGLVEFTS
ncbi:hypothetical protein C4O87_02620 [Pasteurella multocida]|nr:hypothetical protein C4O87_02620 [Pasteurella multocida]